MYQTETCLKNERYDLKKMDMSVHQRQHAQLYIYDQRDENTCSLYKMDYNQERCTWLSDSQTYAYCNLSDMDNKHIQSISACYNQPYVYKAFHMEQTS